MIWDLGKAAWGARDPSRKKNISFSEKNVYRPLAPSRSD
ncbi:hypothetical protein NBRC3293_2539 [Gluconobacter oxydans NBRC 3293]|uniref:Uncharacterized protein n=1 Tax=Gluconobacter oxydans NBRC 3293 TaxID=1315969 RepID=A0A829X509_GLUOY|nr:hypothetical protein NBRC3293_2539 [Gluconobacter oxydans NBRC 3293]